MKTRGLAYALAVGSLLATMGATSPTGAAAGDESDDPGAECPTAQPDGSYAAQDAEGTSAEGCDLIGEVIVTEDGLALTMPETGMFVSGEVFVEEDENGAPTEDIAMTVLSVDEDGMVALTEDPTIETPPTASAPCEQFNYTLMGLKWYAAQVPMGWRINRGSIPNSLNADNVVASIRNGMQNITNMTNTCNLADDFSKTANYNGDTNTSTNIGAGAACLTGDGVSTVGYGPLDGTKVAGTCHWGFADANGGMFHTTDADIRIDSSSRTWTTVGGPNCDAWDVENAMTHEFGHWWGVWHASSGSELTMWASGKKCETKKRTLGAGDVYGLRQVG